MFCGFKSIAIDDILGVDVLQCIRDLPVYGQLFDLALLVSFVEFVLGKGRYLLQLHIVLIPSFGDSILECLVSSCNNSNTKKKASYLL